MLFSGLQINVVEDNPAYTLPEDVPVSQEFREDFNKWSTKFFTPKSSISDGQVVFSGGKAHMNTRTFAQFKAATNVDRALMQMEAHYGNNSRRS